MFLPFPSLFALLTLRYRVNLWFHRMSRFLGRAVLGIAGIRVVVKGGEAFEGRRTRIFLLNHSSQIDLFIMASVMPPGGTPIGKREFFLIPFLGWAWWCLDLLTVDRSNLDRAKVSFAQAAKRLTERQDTVLIAPEGTRSKTGRLGPFKMGAFHLAAQVDAPLIPVVIRGAAACQPMGQILVDPGIVVVEVLPEIPTDDFGDGDLHKRRDEVRAIYLRELGETDDGGQAPPGSPPPTAIQTLQPS